MHDSHITDHIRIRELLRESKLFELVRTLEKREIEIPEDIPIDDIRARVSSLEELRAVCMSDDGWILQKDSKGVRTLYQNHPSKSHIHSIRLDGDVDAPVFILLSMLHEVDMFHKWIPTYSFLGLGLAELVSQPSPTELLVHLTVNVPWPFKKRYCFFHCDGIDCMDDVKSPQIGVIFKNLDSEEQYNIVDDAVKTKFFSPSGVLLTPVGDGRTKLQVVVNLDPQIALIPEWLIDIAVRNFAYLIVLQIRKAVDIVKSDPEYTRRMLDPENAFYNHVKRRIRESLPGEAVFIPCNSSQDGDASVASDSRFSTQEEDVKYQSPNSPS